MLDCAPIILICIVSFSVPAFSFAAAIPNGPYQDFIAACSNAFNQSSGASTPEHMAFGKSLCECTATESKSQKVPLSHLKKETAQIKADPKYKLHDPGLLASLQYCSMKATESLDHDAK